MVTILEHKDLVELKSYLQDITNLFHKITKLPGKPPEVMLGPHYPEDGSLKALTSIKCTKCNESGKHYSPNNSDIWTDCLQCGGSGRIYYTDPLHPYCPKCGSFEVGNGDNYFCKYCGFGPFYDKDKIYDKDKKKGEVK